MGLTSPANHQKKKSKYDIVMTPTSRNWRDPEAEDPKRSFFQSPEPPKIGMEPLDVDLLSPTSVSRNKAKNASLFELVVPYAGRRHSSVPVAHHLAESKFDPRSPSIPRSPALTVHPVFNLL